MSQQRIPLVGHQRNLRAGLGRRRHITPHRGKVPPEPPNQFRARRQLRQEWFLKDSRFQNDGRFLDEDLREVSRGFHIVKPATPFRRHLLHRGRLHVPADHHGADGDLGSNVIFHKRRPRRTGIAVGEHNQVF